MTPEQLRALAPADLRAYYDTLWAGRLPLGTFDGIAWPVPAWPLWRGKVFSELPEMQRFDLPGETPGRGRVKNRIGPFLAIPGHTLLHNGEVFITYPQLGLRDRLRPVSTTLWLGSMDLRITIWFTLQLSERTDV